MKRKISIIFVVIVILMIACCFFACNKKSNSQNNQKISIDTNIQGAGDTYVNSRPDGTATLSSTTNLGYTWLGWYLNEELVSKNAYYYAPAPDGQVVYTAKWKIDDEMEQFEFSSSSDSCEITLYKGSSEQVDIPNYVTSIARGAFLGCSSLKSINIPDSVKSIGEGAFSGCSSLESMTLPFIGLQEGVTGDDVNQYPLGSIFGIDSFDGAIATKQSFYKTYSTSATYYIPSTLQNVTVTGGNILGGAFHNCSMLKTISIGNNVTNIGFGALSGCSSLETLTIPFVGKKKTSSTNTNQYPLGYIFGSNAYSGGVKTTQVYYSSSVFRTTTSSYYIPETLSGVRVTGGNLLYGAFYGCNNLKSVELENVLSIDAHSFDGTELEEVVFSGDVVNWCMLDGIDYVEALNTKIVFSLNQFDGRLVIPEGATKIVNPYALYNNEDVLTEITIPSSMLNIVEGIFDKCVNIKKVNITDLEAWCNIDFGDEDSNPMKYAEHMYLNNHLIQDADINSLFASNSVEKIPAYTFKNSVDLKRINIPSSVTHIGYSAFSGCTAIKAMTIPFVGENADETTASEKTLFGYIFGMAQCESAEHVSQYYDSKNNAKIYYIPSALANLTITGGDILKNAFYNCTMLKSVTLGDDVETIGEGAFMGCTELVSVNISESVQSIGERAFAYCGGIKNIEVPTSVVSIGNAAFWGCNNLQEMAIPFVGARADATVASESTLFGYIFGSSIEGRSTEGYVGAQKVTQYYNESQYAIYYVPIKLNAITINGGEIFQGAFYDCTMLKSVAVDKAVTTIGRKAFSGCSSLEQMTIPFVGGSASATVASESTLFGYIFGTKAYEGGEAAQQYYDESHSFNNYIPSSLIKVNVTGGDILYGAFCGCDGLQTMIIEDSVTSIGSAAFSGCSSLKQMIIPFVGGNATATVASESTLFGYIFGTNAYDGGEATQQYYDESHSLTSYIPSSLEYITVHGGNILYGAFYGCDNITSIVIPDGLTAIADKMFYGCGSLASIKLPISVESIGVKAFYDVNLDHVDINDFEAWCNINFADEDANPMKNAQKLLLDGAELGADDSKTIQVPSSIKSIPAYTFKNCTQFTKIVLPHAIEKIGEGAFEGCTVYSAIVDVEDLNSWCQINFADTNANPMTFAKQLYVNGAPIEGTVRLSIDIECIPQYTFRNSEKITSVVIPNSVVIIEFGAFRNCTGLKSIVIPDSVISICGYAFAGCSSLETVVMSSNITSVERAAFDGCDKLEFNIYNQAKYLGTEAQPYLVLIKAINENITSCKVSEGCVYICNGAFENCKNMAAISIPDSVASIGVTAFDECVGLKHIEASVTFASAIAKRCGSQEAYDVVVTSGTKINDEAFMGCENMISISIPASITSIGSDAFKNCYRLFEVRNASTLNIEKGSENHGGVGYYAGVIADEEQSQLRTTTNDLIVYENGAEKIIVAYTGKDANVVIANGYTKINQYAFKGCIELTSITIPDSVTTIGRGAFEGCSHLTSITIPSSVTSIGENAFLGCYRLVEVYNKSDIDIVAGNTANGCVGYYAKIVYSESYVSKLSTTSDNYIIYTDENDIILICYMGAEGELVLPTDITQISQYAFYIQGQDFVSVKIPNSVTRIGKKAFYSCDGLDTIVFDGTMEEWNAIEKDMGWDDDTGAYTIYCHDGEIEK